MSNFKMKTALLTAILQKTLAVHAADMTMIGMGTVAIHDNQRLLARNNAIRMAKQNAVEQALVNILGPDALQRPEVLAKLENLLDKVTDGVVTSSQIIGCDYEVKLELTLDEKEFKQQLIGLNLYMQDTSSASFPVLAAFDEYMISLMELQKLSERAVRH